MSKDSKKVTFSAEPDVSPDDGPLPSPGPIDTSGVELVGVEKKVAPTPEALAESADQLLSELQAARAADPDAMPLVKWVQFLVPARMSGKSGQVAAVSATPTTRLLLDRKLGVIVIEQHGTLIPLSNVAAFGLMQ